MISTFEKCDYRNMVPYKKSCQHDVPSKESKNGYITSKIVGDALEENFR
jgi:hypothetical protein